MAPVLTYFDFPARGLPIRLAFVLTGQEFEDRRIQRETWQTEEKPKCPFGQVPYLTLDDGTKLPQSYAIVFYVFDKAGKLPTCPLARALNWAAILQIEDSLLPPLKQWFFCKEEDRPGIADEVHQKVKSAMAVLNKFVEQHEKGRGFFHGNEPSPADLVLLQVCGVSLRSVFDKEKVGALLNDAPAIKRVIDKLLTFPAVKGHKDVQPMLS